MTSVVAGRSVPVNTVTVAIDDIGELTNSGRKLRHLSPWLAAAIVRHGLLPLK